MTLYYNRYWNSDTMTQSEHIELKELAPWIYFRLFPVSVSRLHPSASNYSIRQIYYDEGTSLRIDRNFIPHFNGQTPNFENDVIASIPIDERKYVGVLSWRMGEKTGLSGYDIIEQLDKAKADVCILHIGMYDTYGHPYVKEGFKGVHELIRRVDKSGVLPIKLKGYKVKKNVWCNYFLTRPEIMRYYVIRWLRPCMEVIGSDTPKEMHRGKETPCQTFFYEGLFSVFMQEMKLSYEDIKANI